MKVTTTVEQVSSWLGELRVSMLGNVEAMAVAREEIKVNASAAYTEGMLNGLDGFEDRMRELKTRRAIVKATSSMVVDNKRDINARLALIAQIR